MSVLTNLIDGKVINSDTHFSKYLETLSDAGVGEGLEVSSGSVSAGYCWCPCERTNGETFFALVTNTSALSVSTSGTGYIIVSIPQEAIDDGSILNEDGTAIATISFVESLPTKNYLLLATITSGTIEDSRNIIPKITELGESVTELQATAEDLDERVEALEESGAVDHLEEMALVGEKYTLSDTLFKQLTPTLANSTVEAKVGDVAANTEIHIQRIASGTASNQLKLKVKMAGSPTTSLKVEVRKGIKVDVSSTEAYWYGDSSNIIATGTVAYSSFSTSWKEITVNLDNEFGGVEGQLLDIVVYQTAGSGAIVNASNYYIIGCDSTQWSEAFSYVCVNGTTRTRQKLMPYCVSAGFAQSLLCKLSSGTVSGIINLVYETTNKQFAKDVTNKRFYLNLDIGNIYNNNITGKIVSGVFDDVQGLTYSTYTRTLSANGVALGSHTQTPDITVSNSSNITIPAKGTLDFICTVTNWDSSNSYGYKLVNLKFVATNQSITIAKHIYTHKSKPRELKGIGLKAKSTLFGYHTDGNWFSGE